MRPWVFLASIGVLIAGTVAASATVRVSIDLTRQRMHVASEEGIYDWPISSARSGFFTPGGSFAPTHLERMHYSRKYNMSPMPNAIFFRGGYAIHGTYATGSLGRPASHGCVRLSPGNAAALYAMVEREGARISISGTPPASLPFAEARPRRQQPVYRAMVRPSDTPDEGVFVRRRRAEGRALRREQFGYGYPYADPRQPGLYGDPAGYAYAPRYGAPYFGYDQ